jgi:hypothetical protein
LKVKGRVMLRSAGLGKFSLHILHDESVC